MHIWLIFKGLNKCDFGFVQGHKSNPTAVQPNNLVNFDSWQFKHYIRQYINPCTTFCAKQHISFTL